MNVLEMEQEMESLVGSKKHGASAAGKRQLGRNASEMGGMAKAVVQRNFMTNVVVAAGVVLLLLLYLSAGGSSGQGGDHGSTGSVQPKPPVAAPTSADAADAPSSTTPEAPKSSPTFRPAIPQEPANTDEDAPLPINMYSKFATMDPLPQTATTDEATAAKLAEKWGHWHFWDGEEDERPSEDYLSEYPNKDVPNDKFPDGAWQADAVYVNHFLSDAGKLVERAMEAIYAEYGYRGDEMTPEQIAERTKSIFHWVTYEGDVTPTIHKTDESILDSVGWMPKRSYDGLIRRLLHAMMTSDTFTVVVAGHSVVAGAG